MLTAASGRVNFAANLRIAGIAQRYPSAASAKITSPAGAES